ncbi:MAG: serine protease AprX, partial [Chloroflexota bacterium]|nr:serine protease AprX [Chloroflexota bacterium]
SARAPDFVAPGAHIQGLRVPGSYIDNRDAKTVLDGRFMRGSGTSEAAAIASGAVALILDKYPHATPDQVKRLLKTTAYDMPLEGRTGTMGAGELRLEAALSASLPVFVQTTTPAVGGGSIELARGSDHLTRDGVVLKGEHDIFGKWLNADTHAVLEAGRNAWSGGTWNGNVLTGNSWSGNSWSGSSWSGNSWSGNSWSGSSWSGNSWSGSSWSGSSWSGSSWSGSSWSGSSWSTAGWN